MEFVDWDDSGDLDVWLRANKAEMDALMQDAEVSRKERDAALEILSQALPVLEECMEDAAVKEWLGDDLVLVVYAARKLLSQ